MPLRNDVPPQKWGGCSVSWNLGTHSPFGYFRCDASGSRISYVTDRGAPQLDVILGLLVLLVLCS